MGGYSTSSNRVVNHKNQRPTYGTLNMHKIGSLHGRTKDNAMMAAPNPLEQPDTTVGGGGMELSVKDKQSHRIDDNVKNMDGVYIPSGEDDQIGHLIHVPIRWRRVNHHQN